MNGLILINKPKKYTSHDVVNKVRKVLNIKKMGHTGTLDPNATGVLPILIGNATKISKYLIEHDKTYIATLKLGEKRDTGDSEGQVIEKDTDINNINSEQIENVLASFLGKQTQIPPMYSSIKVNGKKLYEYARNGETVEIPPREIEIYNIEFISFNGIDEIVFEVQCSKGTYIRTLCEDIAKKLGTVGYMKELQRTKVDEFGIEDSIDLDKLNEDLVREKIFTIEELFKNKEKIDLDENKLQLFLNGVQLTNNIQEGVYRIYNNNKFIGLGIIKNSLLKRDIII